MRSARNFLPSHQSPFSRELWEFYPVIGPVPANDQKIEVARKPTAIVVASASQPLSTLYKLHLQLTGQAFGVEATRQEERKTRLDITDRVRRAYYDVAETQSQLYSLLASLPYYQESKRLAVERRRRETILESELLEADSQLLENEDSVAEAKNQLATYSESLNDLMGRDIHTQFRVPGVQAIGADLESFEALEARAIENRPDLKKAQLQVRQAEYESRAKKAEYIPEVSLSANYATTVNFGSSLPSNITSVGLLLSFEPWDWGRKRQELAGKRLQEAEAKVTVDSTMRTVLLDVRKAARQIENTRRQTMQTESAQRTSREKLRETQEQFARETVLAKDLFSAQSNLAEADYEHQQALSSFWKARAYLKKSIGEE